MCVSRLENQRCARNIEGMMEYFKGMARNIDGVGDEKADLLDTDPEKTPVHLPLELEDKSSSKVSCSIKTIIK